MTDHEKARQHPRGDWVYSGWNEDGSYGPIRTRYLTPDELEDRRRQRNSGLVRGAWFGYLLGRLFHLW